MAIRKPHGDAGHPCLRWPEMPTACVHRCYHRKRTMCLQGLAAAVPLDAAEGAYETGRLPERARVTFAPARQLNLLAVVSKQHHDKAITLGDADLRFPDFLTVDQENPPQDVAAVIPGSCRPGGKCEMRSTQARPRAARLRPNQKLGSCEWRRSRCGGRRGRGSGDWRCPGASRRG